MHTIDADQGDVAPENDIGIGFTASRKVGSAVARNRARRRLKAAVEEIMPKCGEAGLDYVVIARQATLDRPYAALLTDLRQATERLAKGRVSKGRSGKPGGKARPAQSNSVAQP